MGFIPYAAAGLVSWFAVQQAGLMPALGLLPVIPAIPHSNRAFGAFAEAEAFLPDLFNRIGRHLIFKAQLRSFCSCSG